MKLTITNPADAVSLAAPVLGFIPTNSIVVYLITDPDGPHHVSRTFRVDATINDDAAARFPATCGLTAANTAAAILLGIADEPLQQRTRELLDIVRDALHHADIAVPTRILTHNVTEAGHWTDIDTGHTGPTIPYTDTIHGAMHPNIATDRAAIAAEFATTEPPAPMIDATNAAALVLGTIDDLTIALTTGHLANPALTTGIGILITHDDNLRDAITRMSIDTPEPAAKLWTSIARRLRNEPRIHALTIAALCHYLHSDVLRANFALDAAFTTLAETQTATPTLTAQLDDLLAINTPPAELRALFTGDDT